ncbi:MAG: hypothetical protein E6I80_30170, partial [Chloroflexi bacterium]
LLRGHRSLVCGVTWSPDGSLLASSGLDNAVRLWDVSTGEARQVLQDPDHNNTLFYGVAWSPDGTQLAAASYQQGVHVWEVTTSTRQWVGSAQPTRIRRVAWSPDGTRLASGGDDGSVCLWKASDGTLLQQFQGHRGMVMSVAWSPDGTRLASGGGEAMGSSSSGICRVGSICRPGASRTRSWTHWPGSRPERCWSVAAAMGACAGGTCSAGSAWCFGRGIRGQSSRSAYVPMAGDWPAAAMTIPSRCGIWRAASIYGRCDVTGLTSASILPGSGE